MLRLSLVVVCLSGEQEALKKTIQSNHHKFEDKGYQTRLVQFLKICISDNVI